jgi:CHAD domain-containing protein
MAKADTIDIDPAEPYTAAAARIVRVRADELFAQAEHVLDIEDIERVHAMRVASRRLRAVLEIFAPCWERTGAKGEFRGVLRDVKRLADALGERRDPDVHIDAMVRFQAGAGDAQRDGIGRLIESLRLEQSRGNELLAGALEAAERTELHARLRALADHAEPEGPVAAAALAETDGASDMAPDPPPEPSLDGRPQPAAEEPA